MKTAIIRFSSAGDILLTSLFVRALRKRFPEATIDFITKESFAPLVGDSPYIDRVITIPSGAGLDEALALRKSLRAQEYDLVYDLHNSLRSRIVRLGVGKRRRIFRKPSLAKWLLVRFKINRLRPIVPIPERYLAVGAADGLVNDGAGLDFFIGDTLPPLPDSVPGPYIALAPGARHFTKRWPAERFAELGNKLQQERGGTIVLLGGPDEVETCAAVEAGIDGAVVNLAGKTTLAEAAAAIDRCVLVVANDSALAHVAAARGIPVVTIFGSTVEEFGFAPYSAEAVIVQNDGLSCRPCTTIGRSECPKGHFRCMTDLNVADVAAAVPISSKWNRAHTKTNS